MGAYRVRNPGQTDEQSYQLREQIFDRYECGLPNTVVVPVFDYRPRAWKGDNTLQPDYLGARAIHQVVGEFQASSLANELLKAVGAEDELVNYVSWGFAAVSLKFSTPVGVVMFGLDTAASIYATYQSPNVYSTGWPGALDVNPHISLQDLAH